MRVRISDLTDKDNISRTIIFYPSYISSPLMATQPNEENEINYDDLLWDRMEVRTDHCKSDATVTPSVSPISAPLKHYTEL